MMKGVPGSEPTIRVRWQRPNFSGDTDLSTMSGVYDFMASLPVNGRWSIDASLPYLHIDAGEDSDDFIGDIYAGLQYLGGTGRRTHVLSIGAYFPTGEEDLGMMVFGLAANGERLFSYMPNTLTLTGNYAFYHHSPADGGRLGLEIGPDVLIPTGDNQSDTEAMVHYALTAGYEEGSLLVAVELIGLMELTGENYDDFSDRFMHSFSFGASYLGPHFRPGIFYKLYLSDPWSDWVDGVLGVDIEVEL
jgi:hypothetical protein